MKVADQFRTNELSFRPGGYTVVVVYKTGKSLEYDKVKYPQRYISRILQNPNVAEAFVKS